MNIRLVAAFLVLLASPPVAEASGLGSDEVRRLMSQGDGKAFLKLRDDYYKHGEKAEASLSAAILIGGSDGLDLAEDVILRVDPGGVGLDYAVANGMASHGSPRALEILERAVAVPRDKRTGEIYANAWIGVWAKLNAGPDIYARAAEAAADISRPSLERALHVRVMRLVGRGESIDRDQVLTYYRPFLTDPDPDVRLAAVVVNGAVWDHWPLPELKRLAFGSDPRVRLKSWHLVTRYLTYGEERPGPEESTKRSRRFANMPIHAPEELLEWRSKRAEWSAEQHRLITGEDPPTELPNGPRIPTTRAPHQPTPGPEAPQYRPQPTR